MDLDLTGPWVRIKGCQNAPRRGDKCFFFSIENFYHILLIIKMDIDPDPDVAKKPDPDSIDLDPKN